jgi:hypothetical protein
MVLLWKLQCSALISWGISLCLFYTFNDSMRVGNSKKYIISILKGNVHHLKLFLQLLCPSFVDRSHRWTEEYFSCFTLFTLFWLEGGVFSFGFGLTLNPIDRSQVAKCTSRFNSSTFFLVFNSSSRSGWRYFEKITKSDIIHPKVDGRI